jgi:hypothetical protein
VSRVALGAQQQIATFFESDGKTVIRQRLRVVGDADQDASRRSVLRPGPARK